MTTIKTIVIYIYIYVCVCVCVCVVDRRSNSAGADDKLTICDNRNMCVL